MNHFLIKCFKKYDIEVTSINDSVFQLSMNISDQKLNVKFVLQKTAYHDYGSYKKYDFMYIIDNAKIKLYISNKIDKSHYIYFLVKNNNKSVGWIIDSNDKTTYNALMIGITDNDTKEKIYKTMPFILNSLNIYNNIAKIYNNCCCYPIVNIHNICILILLAHKQSDFKAIPKPVLLIILQKLWNSRYDLKI